jgi:hypothetical protein
VKKDVPRMEMVHHHDVMVELNTQLWNSDATIRGYKIMVAGQASDLYASDMDTWSATSTV